MLARVWRTCYKQMILVRLGAKLGQAFNGGKGSGMKAIILAGGRGTRIAEESDVRPKPMVEIGGRPILWHIMKIYAHHGITEFIVCLGYKGYVIKEYFANYALHAADVTVDLAANNIHYHATAAEPWTVTLVETGDDTATGGRIKRIARYLDGDPFCLTYGDGVADIDIAASIAYHRDQKRAGDDDRGAPAGPLRRRRDRRWQGRPFHRKNRAAKAA